MTKFESPRSKEWINEQRTSDYEIECLSVGIEASLFLAGIWNPFQVRASVATGCRGGTEERWFSGLFCRAQRRAEIAEFVVNLTGSFNGLSNFFAEQRAIAFA